MDPGIVAAWAAVIATLIAAIAAIRGPIIAVKIADNLSRQESRRIAAAALFSRVIEHVHQYEYATDDVIIRLADRENASKRDLELQASPLAPIDTKNSSRSIYNKTVESHSKSTRELFAVKALIQADILALDLLFDSDARECISKLNDLLKIFEEMGKDYEAWGRAQKQTWAQVKEVTKAIHPLHQQVKKEGILPSVR